MSSRHKSYVPVLKKEVESRALRETPGLVDLTFPDGTSRLIHYDDKKVTVILEGLGNLVRNLTQIKNAVLERGIGFIPSTHKIFTNF